jgi:CubicO group peptidase (beta-lactamase class C family)
MMSQSLSRFAVASLVLIASSRWASAADQVPPVRADDAGLSTQSLVRAHQLLEESVARKRIGGAVALVLRHDKIGYMDAVGMRDVEATASMTEDTIFRIASMTKPVISAAVMLLADQGKLDLSDPLASYLPEFKFPTVARLRNDASGKPLKGEIGEDYELVSAYRPITIRDLLRHTSGLTYRFWGRPFFGTLYAKAGICDGITQCDHSLAENLRLLAGMPLMHQPGTSWEYGLSTDVLGRVVEVVSGQSLDTFMAERIFGPLKMHDTHFVLPDSKRSRLAAVYEPGPDQRIVRTGEGPTVKGALIYSTSLPYKPAPGYFSGGAGLVSTARDYARFLQMLLHRGELDGTRLLRPESVDAMTRNQIGDLPISINIHGQGFGYGFGVVARSRGEKADDSVGTYSWGGIYYTHFWVDPRRELIGLLLTQIYPSTHLKIAPEFHRLVNEAVVD